MVPRPIRKSESLRVSLSERGELDFSRPGKPTDNAFIEAFHGRFRQECLNENWFLSLEDAEGEGGILAQTLQWGEIPQRALGNLSPRNSPHWR